MSKNLIAGLADLAQAAYANLSLAGGPVLEGELKSVLKNLDETQWSVSRTADFAGKWRVVAHRPNTGLTPAGELPRPPMSQTDTVNPGKKVEGLSSGSETSDHSSGELTDIFQRVRARFAAGADANCADMGRLQAFGRRSPEEVFA